MDTGYAKFATYMLNSAGSTSSIASVSDISRSFLAPQVTLKVAKLPINSAQYLATAYNESSDYSAVFYTGCKSKVCM